MSQSTTRDEGPTASRAGLARVCALLREPSADALDTAAAILGRVVNQIRETPRERSDADFCRELRNSARLARALLEKAATYHAGWRASIAGRTALYGPGGAAESWVPPGRISVEG